MKLKEYLTNLFNTRAVTNSDGQKTLTLEEIVDAEDFIDGGVDLLTEPQSTPDSSTVDSAQTYLTLEALESYVTRVDLVDILNRLENLEKLVKAVDVVGEVVDSVNTEIW